MSRFWSTTERAGPTLWDVGRFWDRSPRYFRKEGRSRPDPWNSLEQPKRLTQSDAAAVAAFWRDHYGGADWMLDASESWVSNILSCSQTLALGAFREDGKLLGTILSRPTTQADGCILWGNVEYIQRTAVIEGLCVDASVRHKHLAGWLIAWVDYFTSQLRPVAHFWMREVAAYVPGTDIACHTYAFVRIADLRGQTPAPTAAPAAAPPLSKMPLAEFGRLWETNAPTWRTPDSLIATSPYWGAASDCWEVWRSGDAVVVLLNTRRLTRDTREPIWEVQWCGMLESEERLVPRISDELSKEEERWRRMLETVAVTNNRRGLLFASSSSLQGGARSTWPSPWHFGTSGLHSTYLYNFMPPRFWNASVMLLREEV